MICDAPLPAPQAHEIADGARAIAVDLTVDWGAADARDEYAKTLHFCKFGCLALWASEQAGKHDDRIVPKEM